MKVKIILILIGIFGFSNVKSQTLNAGSDQEIKIDEEVTLQGQGKIPLSKNLRCFLWTSDNSDEAIANNHLLTIKVKPQKTTVYTLSIIECEFNTIIDSDKVTVFVDGINTFTLKCAYDVKDFKDDKIKVSEIANHNGQTCSSGIIYEPAVLSTLLPKKSFDVKATCGSKVLNASTVVVDSENKASINIIANNDKAEIKGTFDKYTIEETIDFGVANNALKKIETIIKKGPSPCNISSPTIFAHGSISLNYLACASPRCDQLSVETKGGFSGSLGGINCNFPAYGIPYLGQIEFILNADGSFAANLTGKTNCTNAKFCINPEIEINIGGGIGFSSLKGLVSANLTINSGVNANSELCVIIEDGLNFDYCINIGLQPLSLQGEANVGYGLIKRDFYYEILEGNENLFTYPKNCNQ